MWWPVGQQPVQAIDAVCDHAVGDWNSPGPVSGGAPVSEAPPRYTQELPEAIPGARQR